MIRHSAKQHRQRVGAFYTPPHVARYIVHSTLDRLADASASQPPRILEPSCGDGGFLEPIFGWLAARFPERARTREGRLQLVRDHLYALDVEPSVVEAARCRLARLIAGEQRTAGACETIAAALSANIRVGNTVVGTDIRASASRREQLRVFDWCCELPGVFNDEQSGFDAIVGNPPYINIRRLTREAADVKEYFKQHYRCARGGYDLYVLFIERAYQLLRTGGVCGFIVPNKIGTLGYAEACRRLLIDETTMCEITDASAARVFRGASVYPYVVVWRKEHPRASHRVVSRRITRESHWHDPPPPAELPQCHLNARCGFQLSGNLAVERGARTKSLRELAMIQSGATGFSAHSLAGELEENGKGVDFIVSGNIDRYRITKGDVRFMKRSFQRPTLNLEQSPLSEQKRRLYSSTKIVVAGLTRRIEAAVDATGLALGVQVFAVVPHSMDIHALTAILNSKLLSYLFRLRYQAKRLAGGYLAINKGQLAELPMVDPEGNDRASALLHRLAELGSEMRRCASESPAASPHVDALESEIDACVYELYELEDDEVRRIEADFGPLTYEHPSA